MKFAIWTGAAWETWSPENIKTGGIGGSETAAVMVSRSLAKRGHEVEIYGQFPEAKTEEGVKYIQYDDVLDPGQIEADIFIASRDKDSLALKPEARVKALWMHDINCGDDYRDRLPKYDKILCLTHWAARTFLSYYPHVKSERVVVTRNGIDMARFSPEVPALEVAQKKDIPPRFTYSSSPDRGLDLLLNMWSKIREIAPNAELHVCYGFKTWKAMAKGLRAMELKIAWFEDRLRRMEEEGVIYHDRVGQDELAAYQLRSALWLYPTDFKETSCITAMENQAAGAVPVCTAMAALNETVGERGVLITPFNREPRYEKDFLSAIERLLANPDDRIIASAVAREHALKHFSWDGVAAQWEEIFSL